METEEFPPTEKKGIKKESRGIACGHYDAHLLSSVKARQNKVDSHADFNKCCAF
jgi:hypothetical protein